MILISHRGNINGPNKIRENSPHYITETFTLGYEVEVDVWFVDGNFYLGHDAPQYQIEINWLSDRTHKLWVHCKNIEAISFFNKNSHDLNYFWHEKDTVTLTSKGYLWVYPGKQPIKNSIAVLPEIYNDPIELCYGICSDYPHKFLKK
jgi:hypothetical protein